MNWMTMPRKSAVLFGFILLTGFIVPRPAPAQEEESPTACVGNEMSDLRAALEKQPDNIGLRMRIVRRVLEDLPRTDNRRRSREMLQELQTQLDEIRKLDPEFTYVYRVLARQHERKKEYLKVLEVLDAYSKVTALDYDMRNMRVRALLRLGEDKKNPDPARIEEAAEYVATWFASGTAPVFAETLASTETWTIDKRFRRALMKRFRAMYTEDPKNINLVISYASALYVAGRYESAWTVMQKAEKIGLCDDVMGGRHPLIHFLEWRCPEDGDEESYSGLDLDELRRRSTADADNLSLSYRLAVRLKAKAYTGERIMSRMDDALEEARSDLADLDDPRGAEADALQTRIKRIEEQKATVAAEVKAAYEEALPLALAVRQANPQIDSVTLLLADINTKMGNNEEAVRFLKESIQRVPFFVPLRDKLASIFAEQKKWQEAANELVGVCRLVSCRAADWEDGEGGSPIPIPQAHREKLIADMAQNSEARAILIKTFEEAVKKDSRNPNLQSFLAMAHFFAGHKKEAARWMRRAEALGVCGPAGHEHELAIFIYSREDW